MGKSRIRDLTYGMNPAVDCTAFSFYHAVKLLYFEVGYDSRRSYKHLRGCRILLN